MSTMPLSRQVASARRSAIARSLGAVLAARLLAPGTLFAALESNAPRGSTIALWTRDVSLVMLGLTLTGFFAALP
jgi:hypothetical protein